MRDLPKITFILGGPTVALKSIVLSKNTNKKTANDTGNISLPCSSRNIIEKELFTKCNHHIFLLWREGPLLLLQGPANTPILSKKFSHYHAVTPVLILSHFTLGLHFSK